MSINSKLEILHHLSVEFDAAAFHASQLLKKVPTEIRTSPTLGNF